MKVSNSLAVDGPLQVPDAPHAQVLAALYEVIDPELGLNIVDLGLVYAVQVEAGMAAIEMTMTTPACPLSAYFDAEVARAVREAVPELNRVAVNLTFEPPWDPAMMSGVAKHALGWG
jgi:metal-sulfur cluster biosynthetic enzyme